MFKICIFLLGFFVCFFNTGSAQIKESQVANVVNIRSDFNYKDPVQLQIYLEKKAQQEADENNKDNEKLAKSIQEYLNSNLETDREIKEIPKSTYMYKKLEKRGVLIECGFLSNAEERKKLVTKEYQKNVAQVIADAVVNYYK